MISDNNSCDMLGCGVEFQFSHETSRKGLTDKLDDPIKVSRWNCGLKRQQLTVR